MKVFLHHPTGNRNVRAILSTLIKKDLLGAFGTTLNFNSSSKWLQLVPTGLRQEFLRRSFPLPTNKGWTHPFLEIVRLASPKLGLKGLVSHETGLASVDAVYQNFDKTAASHLEKICKKQTIDAVYAYEDGAFHTFKKAKDLGIKCIYDLPIAYWETGRKLMEEEAERLPNWSITLGGGIKDSIQKLERKIRELELADVVVCPGKFVMDSLPRWAQNKKIVMAPFGSPETTNTSLNLQQLKNYKKPLRVLFVGSMGQRKGLADLFAAVKLLNRNDLELVVMGSLLAPMNFYLNELPNFTYEVGRPNDKVLELMKTCDIFCLPSIVEGRALVMQEAMSQGLPLIITPNTGGEDLVIEGKTGFLVPIRSPEVIAEKLNWFLENRSEIPGMGLQAQKHSDKYTWEKYGNNVIDFISNC